MSEVAIELKGISQSFAGHEILSNVNFKIKQGDVLGLMGGSGSGKTTLIRLILGIYKPTAGKIIFNKKRKQNSIGYASQEDAFYPRLTVLENLKFFGTLYGVSKSQLEKRIPRLLKLVDLDHAAKIKSKKLSGGMKRRLGIALALIHNPEIIIFDEPTAGLDIILQKKIWSLIKKIKKEGHTIIISTHNLKSMQKNCNAFAFIYNGEVYDKKVIFHAMHDHGYKSLEEMFEGYTL